MNALLWAWSCVPTCPFWKIADVLFNMGMGCLSNKNKTEPHAGRGVGGRRKGKRKKI